MKKSIAIIAGGGPAPGINTVIASVAKVFLQQGYNVIGIHEGYKGLFDENRRFIEFNFDICDRIMNVGGSYLQMSRFKPKDQDFKADFFIENNVRLLVTIGGDDTASTANRIAKFLTDKNVKIQNIHVPKTIDNDLPLPEGIPTFGYTSAHDGGTRIASAVYEDARTSGNWFVVCAMGRSAGHLAFGIGTSCQYPMIIIPEMFNKTTITFEKIINLMVSAVLKRELLGIDYGAIMISEGVFHALSEEEIKNSGINFTFDEHGHPELGNVSKAHIFNELFQKKLKALNLNVKSRPVELGYEVRCITPTAFDLQYCSLLGMGVKKLFDEGVSACMVTVDHQGNVKPLYLKDVENEFGKVPPRLVNIDSAQTKLVIESNMHYISADDYQAVHSVPNPSEFDFMKILSWH